MRRMRFLLIFLFLLIFSSTNAIALDLWPLIDVNDFTLFSDNSAEFLINADGSVSGNGTPTVTTGDIFFTMVGINSIEPNSGGTYTIGSGTVYNELTAFTAFKIDTAADVDLGPPGPDDSFGSQAIDLWEYTAVPLGAGDTTFFDWSAGTINVDGVGAAEFTFTSYGQINDDSFFGLVFEDPAQDYNREGTVQAGLDSAVGGTLRLELAFAEANDFLSVIAPYDVGDFATIPAATAIDNTNIALDSTIIAQNWAPLVFGPSITGGNGGFSSPTAGSDWPVFDNLDFTVNTIPEPGTIILLGLGLLSLSALGRKRK